MRIAVLFAKTAEIYASPEDSRRRPRFHSAKCESEILQLLGKRDGRKLAGPSRWNPVLSNVDQAVQKGACGNNNGRRLVENSKLVDYSRYLSILDKQRLYHALLQFEIWLKLQDMLHSSSIAHFVVLGPCASNGRPLFCVEQTELDGSPVGNPGHFTPQRVDFPHQMALADSPY